MPLRNAMAMNGLFSRSTTYGPDSQGLILAFRRHQFGHAHMFHKAVSSEAPKEPPSAVRRASTVCR